MNAWVWLVSATLVFLAVGAMRRPRWLVEVAMVMAGVLPILAESMHRVGAPPPPFQSAEMVETLATSASLNWIAFVWGAGALVAGLRLLVGLGKIAEWRRRSVAMNEAEARQIAELLGSSAAEVRRVIRYSDAVTLPMVVPGWPSVILLPMQWSGWPPERHA